MQLYKDQAKQNSLSNFEHYYAYETIEPIFIQIDKYSNALTPDSSGVRVAYYEFVHQSSSVVLVKKSGKISTTICEVNLQGQEFKLLKKKKPEQMVFHLDENILGSINTNRICPPFSDTTGKIVVEALYQGLAVYTSDKVSVSDEKTQISFNLDTVAEYSIEVRYNFVIPIPTMPMVGSLPTYNFNLLLTVCEEAFEEMSSLFQWDGSQIQTIDSISGALLDSVFPKCSPLATTIILADDESGTPTQVPGISLNAAGQLKVEIELFPVAGASFYLYGLTEVKQLQRTRKINLQSVICNLESLNAYLKKQIPQETAKNIFESEQKIETLSWTPQEFLATIQVQNYGSDCPKVLSQVKFSKLEKDSAPYSSPSLYLSSGSLLFDKRYPINEVITVTFSSSDFSSEFTSTFTAHICGEETISAKEGFSLVQVELVEGDDGNEYFTQYTLMQLLKTSNSKCPIKDNSFQVVQRDGAGLTRTTGLGYVNLDFSKQQLYVQKKYAIASSFSAFLIAETTGGVKGGYYQFQFKITRKINQSPKFKNKIENQSITVHQKDQIENRGLGIFEMKSPQIVDPEGNAISIKASGFEAINGFTFTQNRDSFSIKIDLQKLSIDDAGSHEISIVLGDYGPVPKQIEEIQTFMIEILYVEMDKQELQDQLEFGELDFLIPGKENDDITAFEGENSYGVSQPIILPTLTSIKGETREQKIQKIRQFREQTKKIGYTFPGVSESQINDLLRNQKNEVILPPPSISIDSVTVLGEVKISFNQNMIIPADSSFVDYSKIMKFKLISTASGRIQEAQQVKKRNLESSTVATDPCQGKLLSQMTLEEKMSYYLSLEYDQEDYLANCDIVPRRKQTSEKSSEEQLLQEDSSPAFTWKVVNHTKKEINIKLDFSEPGEISATSQGRDQLFIDLLDVRIFKSEETGEIMKEIDFRGKPQISCEIPPIINDEKTVENIESSTNMVSKITTFLSSANLAVGIILGGSMQQLYGLIRAMQMILLSLLSDVSYPAPAYVFFQGVMLFAQMDIFSGEDFFEKHFIFKETTPISTRFEEFGIENKNFILNSGSYLIMQVFIVLWLFAKVLIRKICVKFAQYSIFRKIGMMVGEVDPNYLKEATLRLLLESYLDISIITLMNLIALKEKESLDEFISFFRTPADAASSVITIVMFIAIIWLPAWIYSKVHSNRENLDDPDFQSEFAWLFEGLRATEYQAALQQYYFLIRRLYMAVILRVFPRENVIQCSSFLLLSCLNLINLHFNQPFLKSKDLYIEIFNEWSILLSSCQVFALLDPVTPGSTRMAIGWGLVCIVSVNIGVNLIIVSYTVTTEILSAIEENYMVYDEWMNKYKIIKNKHVSLEDRQRAEKEFQDYEYCQKWSNQRKWLIQNDIQIQDFPEEIKFWKIVDENNYVERAKNIQIIIVSQNIAKKMRQEKIRDKMAKKLKKSQRLRKKVKNPHQVEVREKLDTIIEVSSLALSEEDYVEKLENHGIFEGIKNETNIFEQMNSQRLFKNQVDKLKLQKFDFVLDQPELEIKKAEEQIMQVIQLDRQERYTKEFCFNAGIKTLINGGQKHVLPSVLQCLIAIPEFAKFFLVKEFEKPVSKALQVIFTGVFQNSFVEYNELTLQPLMKYFRKMNKSQDIFEKILNLLKMELDPDDGQDEKMAEPIVSQTFEGQYCQYLQCSEHKIEFQNFQKRSMIVLGNYKTIQECLVSYFSPKTVKLDCVKCQGPSSGSMRVELTFSPNILVLKLNGSAISWQIDLDDSEYNLFAIICKDVKGIHYSIVKKDEDWYVFKPTPQKIEKEKVFKICLNIQMVFYQKNRKEQTIEEILSQDDKSEDSY